jgi:hypothetical protein
MSTKKGTPKLFSPVMIDLPCVLFFKVQPIVDPVDFVYKICEEVLANPRIRRMRYVNRLTPVSVIGKATEKGLEEVGNMVLGTQFQLAPGQTKDEAKVGGEEEVEEESLALRTHLPLASGEIEDEAKHDGKKEPEEKQQESPASSVRTNNFRG